MLRPLHELHKTRAAARREVNNMRNLAIHSLVLGSASFMLITYAGAAEQGTHSGSFTGQFVKQEAQSLGSPDHVLVAAVAKGTNKSIGKTKFMDGAQVLWSETFELDKGNGPAHGSVSLIDDKGSTTSEYTGTVTTRMVDGQPHTTGHGTWTAVSGTRAYSDAKDSGTYSFTATSPTEFSGEWKGTASFPGQ